MRVQLIDNDPSFREKLATSSAFVHRAEPG